jgi:tetratricopeptide (TPR) repeat protein
MKKITLAALAVFVLVLMCTPVAQAQSPQETLNQYISDLQNNPNDNALREKIINQVKMMRQKPAIPEEAERFMARGAAAIKNAKNPDDFKDAVDEFEKATLAAPWLASAYYNLGIARDKAGMYADAIKSLNLYLLANPDAADVKAVKNLIYEIEYKQEKAARESSPEAMAAKKQNELETWLAKLNGAHFVYSEHGPWGPAQATLDIQGNRIILGNKLIQCVKDWCPGIAGQWYKDAETTLNGFEFFFPESNCFPTGKVIRKGKISDDGYSITFEGCQGVIINFLRER